MQKTLIFTALLLSFNSWATDCTTGIDWSNHQSRQTIECSLNNQLRMQAYKDAQYEAIVPFANILLSFFAKGFAQLPNESPYNIFTKSVDEQLSKYIVATNEEMDSVTGGSRSDLIEQLDLKNDILKLATNPSLTPEQQRYAMMSVALLLDKAIIKNSEGQYQMQSKIFADVLNNEFDIDKLKSELNVLTKKIDSKKIQETISNSLELLIKTNFAAFIQRDPDLNELMTEREKLEKLQAESGNDFAKQIKTIDEKIEQAIRTASKEYNFQQFEYKLEQTQHAITIATSLLSLKDPMLAKKIQEVGKATINITKGITAIAKASALKQTAGLGPYAIIAVSAVSIFKSLGGQRKTPEQMILEQIQKLAEQVEDLRQQMHSRFDRVEKILGEIYTNIMEQFENLDDKLLDTNKRIKNVEVALQIIDKHLDRIDHKIYVYQLEGLQKPYLAYREKCILWTQRYTTPITEEHIRQCIDTFRDWAVEYSSSSVLAGMKIFDTSDWAGYVSTEIKGSNYESSINLLASVFQYNLPLPNPIVWASGSLSLLRMRDLYPQFGNISKMYTLTEIENKGYEIENFINNLFSQKASLSYIQQAKDISKTIFDETISSRDDYIYNNYIKKLIKRIQETISQYEKLSQEQWMLLPESHDEYLKQIQIAQNRLKTLQEDISSESILSFLHTDNTDDLISTNLVFAKPCHPHEQRFQTTGKYNKRRWTKAHTLKQGILLDNQVLTKMLSPEEKYSLAIQNDDISFCYEMNINKVEKFLNFCCPDCGIASFFDLLINEIKVKIVNNKTKETIREISKPIAKNEEIKFLPVMAGDKTFTYRDSNLLWEKHLKNILLTGTVKSFGIFPLQPITELKRQIVSNVYDNYIISSKITNLIEKLDAFTKITRASTYFSLNYSYNSDLEFSYSLTSGEILKNGNEMNQYLINQLPKFSFIANLEAKRDELATQIYEIYTKTEELYQKEPQPYSMVGGVLNQINDFINIYYSEQ